MAETPSNLVMLVNYAVAVNRLARTIELTGQNGLRTAAPSSCSVMVVGSLLIEIFDMADGMHDLANYVETTMSCAVSRPGPLVIAKQVFW
jgi:hypothetical protein